MVDLAQRLRARGIRFGVVCDGDLTPLSDAQWVAQSLERCRTLAGDPDTAPDDFVWPHRMLSETDPSAWTYALKSAVTSLGEAQDGSAVRDAGPRGH
jgi:hypothetical protein